LPNVQQLLLPNVQQLQLLLISVAYSSTPTISERSKQRVLDLECCAPTYERSTAWSVHAR
jgi:hypothetical protein